VDPMAVDEAPAWTRRQRRRHGVEADAEEEQARGVEPVMVGEVVSESPVWTRWWSGRHRHGPDSGGGVEAIEEWTREWRQNDTTRVRV
jgi:hypothetical protein